MEYVEYIDLNNNKSGIYCIFNMRNGKLYIGSAKNLRKRTNQHIYDLMNSRHCNKHLQSAWNKDGIISFLFIVMEYCEKEKLIEREQHFINLFDFDSQLYNFLPTAGSFLGGKRSDEFRKKISEARRGKKLSDEHCKKLSEARRGKKFSDEHRKSISKGNTGRIFSEETRQKMSNSLKGRIISEESRLKMSEARRGKKLSDEHRKNIIANSTGKPVNQIDIHTNEILATFKSASEAARTLGRSASCISSVCNGRQKSAYGYKWQFVTN